MASQRNAVAHRAAQVNTKFVAILGATLIASLAVIGGLWYLQIRSDAERNIKLGDQMMAEGDYKAAADMYGRAVHKQPGNLDYVRKLEGAVLSVVPQNVDEARERYGNRLSLLEHEALHNAQNPDSHMRLLNELFHAARYSGAPYHWRWLATAADKMWERVPVENSKRIHARLYRGLAKLRMANLGTEEEVGVAEMDLQIFLEQIPDSDRGWAELAMAQLIAGQRLEGDRQERRAAEKYADLMRTYEQGLRSVPDGPEMAIAQVRLLSANISTRDREADLAALDGAVQHMIERINAGDDHMLYLSGAQLLQVLNRPGDLDLAEDLLAGLLAENPEAHAHRAVYAEVLFRDEKLDAAEAECEVIINAEPLPVSYLSRMLWGLQDRCAGLLCDIAAQRWDRAEDADKPAMLARLREARAQLAEFVPDQENALSIRADGKIAYAEGDYQTAAAKFDRLTKSAGGVRDSQVFYYAAICLERIGQLGAAHDRVVSALEFRPNNTVLMLEKGKLEFRMLKYEEARETAAAILKNDPESLPAKELAQFASLQLAGGPTPSDEDPIVNALNGARTAAGEGDLDTARAVLLPIVKEAPDDVRVLDSMSRIEYALGNSEQAKAYITRALELQPDNMRLKKFDVLLTIDDPIEAASRLVEMDTEDANERAVLMVIQLDAIVDRERKNAEQAETDGDTAAAAKSTALADRADAELEKQLALAESGAPNNPRLVDFHFRRALRNRDWPAAESAADRAKAIDLDRAGGLIYVGQLELQRGNLPEAIVALTDATARKAFSSNAWRLLGIAQRRSGNFTEAEQAFEQAYKNNPNEIGNVREYVSLLVQRGDHTRALLITRTARQLDPSDRQLRELWLELEAETGDGALALRTRREQHAKVPDDSVNATRLASFLTRRSPARELLLDENGEGRFSDRAWSRMRAAEQDRILEEESLAWQVECDLVLDKIEELRGNSLSLAGLRATVMRDRGKPAEGEAMLQAYIDSLPKDELTSAHFIGLAQFQAEIERLEAAAETMSSARQYQDPEVREVDQALGHLLFQRGKYEAAIPIFASVLESSPTREISLMLLESLVQVENYDEAERRLQAFIADQGEDFVSAMYTASVAEGQGNVLAAAGNMVEAERKYEAQFAALTLAERFNPAEPMPHVHRARRWLKEYRRSGNLTLLGDAMASLDRADEVRADFLQTSMVRVEVLQAKGDVPAAVAELERLLKKGVSDRQVRRQLIMLLLVSGDLERAVTVIDDAVALQPNVSLWHEMQGDLLYEHKRDPRAAVEAYVAAFKLLPSHTGVVKLATALLAVDPPQNEEVIALLEQFPVEVEADPALSGLAARAMNGMGKREESLTLMRDAYKRLSQLVREGNAGSITLGGWFRTLTFLFPMDELTEAEKFVMEACGNKPGPDEYRWLASAWAASGPGGFERAIELQGKAIDVAADGGNQLLADLHASLGNFYFMVDDKESAMEAYKRTIDLDPKNALILNNYSYIMAVEFKEPSTALAYAEQAEQLRPEDSSTLDTLGWIHHLMENCDQAETHLRKSVRIKAEAGNTFHLARVLFDCGKISPAETYLQQAAELNPDSKTKEEIDRLADDIRTRR